MSCVVTSSLSGVSRSPFIPALLISHDAEPSLSRRSDKVKWQLIAALRETLTVDLYTSHAEPPIRPGRARLRPRRRWHVGARCRRCAGAPPVIGCIYLRGDERGRLPRAQLQSDLLRDRDSSTPRRGARKTRAGGKQRKPADLFLHTPTQRPFMNISMNNCQGRGSSAR